jgi:hypothetical protein
VLLNAHVETVILWIIMTMLKPVRINLRQCTEARFVGGGEAVFGRMSLNYVDILKIRS